MPGVRKFCLILICTAVAALAPPPAPAASSVDLRMDRLASALTLLSASDRQVVHQAAELIREGENVGALARLSTLTHSNAQNSSLRILIGFVQLKLGNLTGALDEAKKAHEAPNGNSYKCFFLGKVAYLTGDKATCQRELIHVKSAGDMPEGVRQLENDLKPGKARN